jgi:hypothetical protein
MASLTDKGVPYTRSDRSSLRRRNHGRIRRNAQSGSGVTAALAPGGQ